MGAGDGAGVGLDGVVGSEGVDDVSAGAVLTTGAGVLGSAARAGAANDRAVASARTTVADAKAIGRRVGWFADDPGVLFTVFLSSHRLVEAAPRSGCTDAHRTLESGCA
jgi:hypothetical protein